MQPTKMERLLEGMARIIESLLEELRRRGVVYDGDLEEYEEYRDEVPREDA